MRSPTATDLRAIRELLGHSSWCLGAWVYIGAMHPSVAVLA